MWGQKYYWGTKINKGCEKRKSCMLWLVEYRSLQNFRNQRNNDFDNISKLNLQHRNMAIRFLRHNCDSHKKNDSVGKYRRKWKLLKHIFEGKESKLDGIYITMELPYCIHAVCLLHPLHIIEWCWLLSVI